MRTRGKGSLIACGCPQLSIAQRLALFLVTPTLTAVLNGLARRLLSVAPWCDTTEQSEHL